MRKAKQPGTVWIVAAATFARPLFLRWHKPRRPRRRRRLPQLRRQLLQLPLLPMRRLRDFGSMDHLSGQLDAGFNLNPLPAQYRSELWPVVH